MKELFTKIKNKISCLNEIDFNREKINSLLCTVYVFLMTVIFPILPLGKDIGLYSLKTSIYIGLTLLVLGAYVTINYDRKIKKVSIYTYMLSIYTMILLISTILSKYGRHAYFGTGGRGEGFLTILCYVVTFIIVMKNFKYNEKTLWYILISACIVSLIGIIQVLYGNPIDLIQGINGKKDIARSTMGNPNFLSSYLCIILPISLFKFLNTENRWYMYISSMLFAGLIASNTLGGFITFIIYYLAITIYSLIRQRFNKDIVIKTIAFIFIMLAIVNSISLITNINYLGQILSLGREVELLKEGSSEFATKRGLAWKISFEMIERNPIFGAGLDCFALESNDGTYGGEEYINRTSLDFFDKAHSEYLQIASTSGIPSLIVYLAILFTIVIRLFIKIIVNFKKKIDTKYSRYIIVIFLIICSYAFQAAANISTTQVAPIYFIVLGIGAALSINEKEEVIDEKEQYSEIN